MERLRELRQKIGYSQERMATEFNLSQKTYSNYENGIHEPSLATLKAMAAYFHVSIDYLLGVTDIRWTMDDYFAESEQELLSNLRALPDRAAKVVFELAQNLGELYTKEK